MSECKILGCNKKTKIKQMCSKHYEQKRIHGKVLKTNYDLNEFIFKKDYAELIIYHKAKAGCSRKERLRAKIDLEDVDKIKDKVWGVKSDTHNNIYLGSKRDLLHRIIMGCSKDKIVDHINHDTLDNRKSNLRTCSYSENNFNNKAKGYSFNPLKKTKPWRVRITEHNKTHQIGYFATEKEAILARKLAELKYFKEFRCEEI